MSDIDVFGDDDLHPAAFNDEPPPLLADDPMWQNAATRNLRRIANLEDRKHEVCEAFRKEIDRLVERMNEEVDKYDKQIEFWRKPLVQLHEAILLQDPSRKTITLPYGKLKSTTYVKPMVRVIDKDAFEQWAHTNAPHLLKVKYSADPKAIEGDDTLKPMGEPVVDSPVGFVNVNGEVVPGIELSARRPTFSIQLDGEL